MRIPSAVFAVAIALGALVRATPAHAAAATAARCPDEAPHIVATPQLTLPASSEVKTDAVGFAADIGSDGRVRDMQLVASSGDRAVDAQVREALAHAAYRPARTNCVSYSSVVVTRYRLTDASPAPPQPANRSGDCVPFVNAFITPVRAGGGRRGSAVVAVDLDASGSRLAARLEKGSGTPALDTEALAAARSGSFAFSADTRCRGQQTTYLLELRFE